MERGALCRIGKGPSGEYYNHQTWADGRNVVRYVPPNQVQALRAAIEGYRRFRELMEAYADLIIAQTRQKCGLSSTPSRQRRIPKRKTKTLAKTND